MTVKEELAFMESAQKHFDALANPAFTRLFGNAWAGAMEMAINEATRAINLKRAKLVEYEKP